MPETIGCVHARHVRCCWRGKDKAKSGWYCLDCGYRIHAKPVAVGQPRYEYSLDLHNRIAPAELAVAAGEFDLD